MKRLIISSVVLLAFFNLFSREEILIDFSNLGDTTVDFSKDVKNGWGMENAKDDMKASLHPSKWFAAVTKSSRIPVAVNKTYAMAVDNSLTFPGETVLAVRTFFPDRNSNSHVDIKPPFDIPSYYDDLKNPDGEGTYFINKGVIRNVGIMRKLSIRVLGNNFNYGLYVKVKDNLGNERDIFMGTLNFLGWRTLTWINPNYENEKKYKDKARSVVPYYPDEYPFVKLLGIVIQRGEAEKTGNFTCMFKDIVLDYDEHFLKIDNYEHHQEDIFHIYREELLERAAVEMEKVNRMIYLQWLENRSMDVEKVSEQK